MHKKVRRLTLHKETLRNLDADRLGQVQGGYRTATNCETECENSCAGTSCDATCVSCDTVCDTCCC